MSIIDEQICGAKWLEEYANTSLINPMTKEEAIARLTKLGILLSMVKLRQNIAILLSKTIDFSPNL